jgi:GntR family transcriptional repressor for pyruvate dehydrogenase complex
MTSNQPSYLTPIARATLTDMIVERLINFIVDNNMKPGDRLPSERELMTQLSIGRSSLREAIKVLKAIGIVEVSIGAGMFVGRGDMSIIYGPLSWSVLMSESNLREVMESRRIIEVELAGLAAERAAEDEIKEIGDKLKALKDGVNSTEKRSIQDVEFHLGIARASHNSLLYHILNTLHRLLQAMLAEAALTYHAGVQPSDEITELMPIYEAIRSRNAQAARRAMETHLLQAEARLPAIALDLKHNNQEEQ